MLEALGDYLETRDFPRDPLVCPVGTPLIPALPDNQDIGQVRREAAERGDDVHKALAAVARQAGPIHHDQLYKAVKRLFSAATAAALREECRMPAHSQRSARIGCDTLSYRMRSRTA
ncbi:MULTISPECIES: hypothetical protein [Paraburkholderia]|uniref:hypothetical protein n=1 Tax=Paraburkholderia TaxID=1822464 RepID=UPI0016558BDC|nr:hypothetical protein [Paraburkholderia podalyriae]